MSEARKILDERLAKGEITELDHERLCARLINSQNATINAGEQNSSIDSQKMNNSLYLGLAGLITAAFFYYIYNFVINGIFETCVKNGGNAQFCTYGANTHTLTWILFGAWIIFLIHGGYYIGKYVSKKL